jgi:hypothetical protein
MELRKIAAQWMRQHAEQLIPFIGDEGSIGTRLHTCSYHQLTQALLYCIALSGEFFDRCNKIESTKEWGDHV